VGSYEEEVDEEENYSSSDKLKKLMAENARLKKRVRELESKPKQATKKRKL